VLSCKESLKQGIRDKALLLENVKEFLSHEHGATPALLTLLTDAGFHYRFYVVSPHTVHVHVMGMSDFMIMRLRARLSS
jgi:site-specific DNA-cytosine methylase